MEISETGLALIQKWEGYYDDAYLCPANVWTIGYGTTKWSNGTPVKKGDKINRADALVLLKKQVNEHASTIPYYITRPLTQNQFDALASFQYNLGKHILKGSSLARFINAGEFDKATSKMKEYNKGGGKVLRGLVNRRNDEVMLFNKQSIVKVEEESMVLTKTGKDSVKSIIKKARDKGFISKEIHTDVNINKYTDEQLINYGFASLDKLIK